MPDAWERLLQEQDRREIRNLLWKVVPPLVLVLGLLVLFWASPGDREAPAGKTPGAGTHPTTQAGIPYCPPQHHVAAPPLHVGRPPTTDRPPSQPHPQRTTNSTPSYVGATAGATSTSGSVQISGSAWQHVRDRHTVGGTMTAGKSVFNSGEDVGALIRNAGSVAPIQESNGYFSREADAGRNIGYDGFSGKQTSRYRVITTETGQLVTAYPVAR